MSVFRTNDLFNVFLNALCQQYPSEILFNNPLNILQGKGAYPHAKTQVLNHGTADRTLQWPQMMRRIKIYKIFKIYLNVFLCSINISRSDDLIFRTYDLLARMFDISSRTYQISSRFNDFVSHTDNWVSCTTYLYFTAAIHYCRILIILMKRWQYQTVNYLKNP